MKNSFPPICFEQKVTHLHSWWNKQIQFSYSWMKSIWGLPEDMQITIPCIYLRLAVNSTGLVNVPIAVIWTFIDEKSLKTESDQVSLADYESPAETFGKGCLQRSGTWHWTHLDTGENSCLGMEFIFMYLSERNLAHGWFWSSVQDSNEKFECLGSAFRY